MAVYQHTAKKLFDGALTTTLTTTLFTATEPTHVIRIIFCNTNTTTVRKVTLDASGSYLLSAVAIPPGKTLPFEVPFFLEDGDAIRAGQDVGTDVYAYISGVERADIS